MCNLCGGDGRKAVPNRFYLDLSKLAPVVNDSGTFICRYKRSGDEINIREPGKGN